MHKKKEKQHEEKPKMAMKDKIAGAIHHPKAKKK